MGRGRDLLTLSRPQLWPYLVGPVFVGLIYAALAFGLQSPLVGLLLSVYSVFCAAVTYSAVDVERAYWWFPALNTLVGTVLTLASLWEGVYG